ncbi:MAG: glutathione S-transferase family protein [Alphaproteobacteria bacterium]|nr:glutathione S-transferase family protein [Alphaproteobacteria bacterium]
MSITLYAFPTAPGFFNGSPYCGKVDILFKMAGIDFTTEMPEDYKVFSKGKLPVIKDGDAIIQDSEIIRYHLAETYGHSLDEGLSAEAKATGHAVCRMLDDRSVLGLVWSRWVEDEGWAQTKQIFFEGDPTGEGEVVRGNIREGLTGAGFGLHSEEEQRRFIKEDIDAIAALLGDREWFLSDTPTYLDATVFSFIANFYGSPIRTWIAPLVAAHDNLVAYFERGMARWYPEGLKMLQQTAAE